MNEFYGFTRRNYVTTAAGTVKLGHFNRFYAQI